ncbi:GNAT family N-acetyltransferase [Marinobacter halodurans]|uniref:GNAT family N-acetyltransferase n=1 Tax=Marinobacter halodurans TaxID=2528979 RepID=A0ABY1ZFW6_9GAMM|nr:GNAT family N-acetyltransferase [Marinobacter halodurans]TBW50180.1 GNAT family N-acetyltransferase [Marinobacter halodurans]
MTLFQTRAWQDAWWSVWGNTPGFRLVREGQGKGSGLYVDRYRFRGVLPIRCLQFIGTNYRRLSTPRTEYNGLAGSGQDAAGGIPGDYASLMDFPWSEAVFRDIVQDAADHQALQRLAQERGLAWREVASDAAYHVDTSGDFEDYVAGLGRNTRLRFFNRRKVLESLGDLSITNAWEADPAVFFECLNDFHVDRWGSPCFGRDSLRFHRRFLDGLAAEGGAPELSLLRVNGEPVSVLYNVRFEGRTYNLQSGFVENFHRKVALGSLHLGYAIEDAFREPGTALFDLLAGQGKNSNYKQHIATGHVPLVSVMLVRSAFYKWLYRVKAD